MRDLHAEYFLELVNEATPHLWSRGQLIWLARLETDHDNLRAALTWIRDQPGGAELVARLALSLSWFWYLHGHMAEGRQWLESVLATPKPARARALTGAGFLAHGRRDLAGAAALLEDGRALAREADDVPVCVRAAMFLGFSMRDRGEFNRATALVEESLAIARACGDRWGIGYATYLLSSVARDVGDLEREARFAEESLPQLRKQGERLGIGYAQYGLAAVSRLRGDYADAAAYVVESLPFWNRLGNDWGKALGRT